jgi:hypothetical protein
MFANRILRFSMIKKKFYFFFKKCATICSLAVLTLYSKHNQTENEKHMDFNDVPDFAFFRYITGK